MAENGGHNTWPAALDAIVHDLQHLDPAERKSYMDKLSPAERVELAKAETGVLEQRAGLIKILLAQLKRATTAADQVRIVDRLKLLGHEVQEVQADKEGTDEFQMVAGSIGESDFEEEVCDGDILEEKEIGADNPTAVFDPDEDSELMIEEIEEDQQLEALEGQEAVEFKAITKYISELVEQGKGPEEIDLYITGLAICKRMKDQLDAWLAKNLPHHRENLITALLLRSLDPVSQPTEKEKTALRYYLERLGYKGTFDT